MTRLYVELVPVQPLLSVAVASIGNVPCCCVVPESTPLVESEKPLGNVLAVVNVPVPCAPLCVNCSLNAALTVPVAFAGFVTVIVWQLMTRVYVAPVPEQPLLSVTDT